MCIFKYLYVFLEPNFKSSLYNHRSAYSYIIRWFMKFISNFIFLIVLLIITNCWFLKNYTSDFNLRLFLINVYFILIMRWYYYRIICHINLRIKIVFYTFISNNFVIRLSIKYTFLTTLKGFKKVDIFESIFYFIV